MRVLFVVLPAIKGSFIHTMMPLGVGYLAASVRQRHETRVWDMDVERGGIKALFRIIRDFRPDVIGISTVTPTYASAIKLVGLIKAEFPTVKVVLGGHHVTAAPEFCLSSQSVDFVMVGESELSFPRLLEALETGGALSEVPGLGYREGTEIRLNPPAPLVQDLDSLPFPAWDLMPMSRYRGRFRPAMSVICTRGCPFNCIYCASHKTHGKKVRRRSVENVIEELKILTETYGVRYLLFFDETFTLDRDYTRELCERMTAEKINAESWCYTRVDRVDPETLRLMKRAGFVAIAYGFETGSQRLLDLVDKKTTLSQARDAVRMTRDAGILPEGYFLLNLPTETWQESLETVKFATELDIPFFNLLFATPYPGTRLLEVSRKNGLLLEDVPADDYAGYWFHSDLIIRNPDNPHPGLRRLQLKTNLKMLFRPLTILAALRYLFGGSQIRPFDLYQISRLVYGKLFVRYDL